MMYAYIYFRTPIFNTTKTKKSYSFFKVVFVDDMRKQSGVSQLRFEQNKLKSIPLQQRFGDSGMAFVAGDRM